jgi:hypothetical protein
MRKLWRRAAALACVLALAGAAWAAGKKSSVRIVNKSRWDIHQLYMSPEDEKSWGPDQLGKKVIKAKGGEYTLTDIPCGTWDIKVVDEDGDECILEGEDLCADNAEWKITDDELLTCQGWK